MAETSAIEWTDATWNPITGCSIYSAGCTNCYAMRLAGTRLRDHPSRQGLTADTRVGPVWTGEVRFNEEWLTQPLAWKRPRRIFVCAHADLFHESVPAEWIDRIFAVMALAPQHQFQVLTKRAERMRAYLSDDGLIGGRAMQVAIQLWGPLAFEEDTASDRSGRLWEAQEKIRERLLPVPQRWPLPNVWLGVSVEDQRAADERIPHLLATPAAVRWVSAEPLLGPINLTSVNGKVPEYGTVKAHGTDVLTPHNRSLRPQIDWVVAGGESGAGARPMHPAWARSLRDQRQAAGVPFLFKQWGAWSPDFDDSDFSLLRQNQFHAGTRVQMARVGKKRAGRILDGAVHDGFPETR